MVDDRGTPIYEIISRVESSEAELTVSAREMLAIPVMEQVEAGQHVDWKQVERSIHAIVGAAKRNAHHNERISGKLNAMGIILGFWAQFCNIPPFCDETRARR